MSGYENVRIINDDVLKVDIAGLVREDNGGRPIKVVANLPYYITTPIIMGLFESHAPIESITVMVQREVAERMQSAVSTAVESMTGFAAKAVNVHVGGISLQ